jgi:hypothetical protein
VLDEHPQLSQQRQLAAQVPNLGLGIADHMPEDVQLLGPAVAQVGEPVLA